MLFVLKRLEPLPLFIFSIRSLTSKFFKSADSFYVPVFNKQRIENPFLFDADCFHSAFDTFIFAKDA